MKSRKAIRVLTFSFFLLMIGFFVTWQGGLLNRFLVPEEQPYQSIISRIPDTVKEVPLDVFRQEANEQEATGQQQPISLSQPATLSMGDPLMLASSKTIVFSSPDYLAPGVKKSPLLLKIKPLFERRVRSRDKKDNLEAPPAPDLRIFYGPGLSTDEVYIMSSSKTTIMADPNDELRKHIFPGGQIRSLFPPDQNPAKIGPKR